MQTDIEAPVVRCTTSHGERLRRHRPRHVRLAYHPCLFAQCREARGETPARLPARHGLVFPQWNGSALMGGLATQTLNRITFDGKGGAASAERWAVGHQIRDVAIAPDGAVWMIENTPTGGLFRLTPK